MEHSVKDKLNEKAYELINLPYIEFGYGDIDFFDKSTIDSGQAGFRYNSLTNETINEWVGDDYVIIGYDSVAGCGPDPYIVKTSDPKLPVYWLMTDGGDWANPDFVCDNLETFNKIINMLKTYENYFSHCELNEKIKQEIINKICDIEGKKLISDYWDHLLDCAMPFED